MPKKEWKIKNEKYEGGLDELNLSPLLCRLLTNRGFKDKKITEAFLNPKTIPFISPFEYEDMQVAIDRIKYAVDNNEKILIWGDFDADGVTSTSILYKVFKKIGANFMHFIPTRKEMGHGLNVGELFRLISKEHVKLVITVDCGISNIVEANLLKSHKVDLIITDHHRAGDEVPCAIATIVASAPYKLSKNLSLDDIKSLSDMCGAGVALKLSLALEKYYPMIKEIEDELKILACVGTISDVVPLLGENRRIVKEGLELINEGKMPQISELFKKCSRNGSITSYDVAFVLTPRINAAGRLQDVKIPFEFLTTSDLKHAISLIEPLNNFNQIRQNLCEEMFCEIKDKIKVNKDPVIVMYNENWHIGIIGIVASSVVEATSKPAFLMTRGEDNTIRCSIRGPKGYSVYKIISHMKDCFLGFGGHAQAGGFSFDEGKISFNDIKKRIIETFKELYADKKPDTSIDCDMELEASDVTFDLIDAINALEPFGTENLPPLFCIKNVNYISHRFVGSDEKHLKLDIEKEGVGLNAVWWNKKDFKKTNMPFDILFYPKLNEFNGKTTIQLELQDTSLEEKDEIKIYDHRRKTNILPQINEYLARDNVNIFVWAKNRKTKEKIKEYKNILDKSNEENESMDGIMFFDYPPSLDALCEIFKKHNYSKIHFMKDDFEESIDCYVKEILGMTKYATNKLNGKIDIEKMAHVLCVTNDFVSVTLEIFEKEGAIKIVDENTVKYISPYDISKFKQNAMYEVLNDEFENILNFKNELMNMDLDRIRELI